MTWAWLLLAALGGAVFGFALATAVQRAVDDFRDETTRGDS